MANAFGVSRRRSTVTHPTNAQAVEIEPAQQPTEAAPATAWLTRMGELLAEAAALCVENDTELEAWMRSAWTAYVEARPGYREFLEESHLKQQLEQLREVGRIGLA
jgi:hypothetical protein